MTKTKTKTIAKKVDLDKIQYARVTRTCIDKKVVVLAASSKRLFFNPSIVEMLCMQDWKQVIVGYEKHAKVIVLKLCDVEEFGGVMVRPGVANRKKDEARAEKCRIISIAHLIRAQGFTISRYYKAERCEGRDLILLEATGEVKK